MASEQEELPSAADEDAGPSGSSMFAARRARQRAAKAAPVTSAHDVAREDGAVAAQAVGTTVPAPPEAAASVPAPEASTAPGIPAPAVAAPTQAPPTDVATLYSEYAVAEEAAPEPAATAPTPEPSAMDSILRAALASPPRVVPGRPATSAQAQSGTAPSDDVHEATLDPDGETPPVTAMEDADGAVDDLRDPAQTDLDLIVYKGIENAHQVFMALMKSGGLPDKEVAQIWSDYLSYEQGAEKRERIADLSARERMIQEEEARLLKQEAASSATNGGALASLFGSMMSAPSRRRKARSAEALANAKLALANDKVLSSNKFADEQRLRIYETKARAYNERMAKLFATIDDAAASVRSYNDAFIDAPEASGFRKAAELWAEQSGSEMSEVMREVVDGKAPESVMSEFYAARERILANDDVLAAHRRVLANEAFVRDGFSDAVKEGERMTRAFPDRFDHDKQFDGLTRAMDGSFQNSPKPLAEPQGPDMAERFKEMAENMQRSFAAMFEALSSIFSRA